MATASSDLPHEEDLVNASIAELVGAALGQNQLSALAEVLRGIAGATDAWGAVLWQVAPGSEPRERRGHAQLLADWFPEGKRLSLYNLPLEKSLTGLAITEEGPRSARIDDPRVFREPFLEKNGVRWLSALPLYFADGSAGALNLYRTSDKPFHPNELSDSAIFAALVPGLYQTLRERVSFQLLHDVNQALHKAELEGQDRTLGREEIERVVQKVCELVNDALQCLETSIFLEDRLVEPGLYKLAGTTWPFTIEKKLYQANKEFGLTGWVLAEGQPLRITNLSRYKEELPELRARYPGIVWKDPLHVDDAVSAFLTPSTSEWIPRSFLAVPIRKGEEILGALRCSIAKQAPYYFGDNEENLLTLVAAQIGRVWSSWIQRREIDDEVRTWKQLVASIRELNRFVLAELAKQAPNEGRLFDKSLQLSRSVIRNAEVMDIRLVDETTRELYFARTHGGAWLEGSAEQREERLDRRFPLDTPDHCSAGAYVIATGEVYVIPDVRRDPYYSETFPNTQRMIVAPMESISGDEDIRPKVLGVLDIRSTDGRPFPRYSEDIAGILGSQLGLYHDLATNIGRVHRLETTQIQSFQDLKHQFKTPISQALKRVELALKRSGLSEELEADLRKIRGLVGKAVRVSLTTGLFADLASGKELRVKASNLSHDELIQLLIEASMDNQLLSDPRQNIRCRVEIEGFETLRELIVDRSLLEQAINDLLDNAFKYSYSQSDIRIYGSFTKTDRFQIAVANRGIPIRPHDRANCVKREWQGEEAKLIKGQGSGIGLWITDHIMRAHGGELMIIPTKPDGITEIKMLFPENRYRK